MSTAPSTLHSRLETPTPIRRRKSILVRTALGVIGITFLVGTLFIGATSAVTSQQAQQRAMARLGELLDTIENTASIACFVEDPQLAGEVAAGLIKNSEVARVVIRSPNTELARQERPHYAGLPPGESGLTRAVHSPFNPERIVGEIRLEPNLPELERQAHQERRFVGILLAIQLAVVSAAIILIVLRLIVSPIKSISDGLHQLNAPAGDRLHPPLGHEGNEIGRLVDDINGLTGHLVSALQDEHELRLRQAMDERKYRDIFENAESGIFVANLQGELLSHNRSLGRLAGIVGDQPLPHLQELAWRQPEQVSTLLQTCLKSNASQEDDLELLTPDMTRWLHLGLTPIGDGLVQGIVSDITQRKLVESFAQRMTVTDPLTGLGNRSGLEQQVQPLLGDDNPQAFALLLINLDGFKQVNDGQGFAAGDELLRSAANRLRGCIKATDWLGRIAGDEFALILPGVAEQQIAVKVSQRIVEALGLPYELQDSPAFLGGSIGIAFHPADGSDLPTLLRNAELALDRVKANGGHSFQFFDPGMAAQAESRRRMENELRQAIQRGELRLYYQPIVDIQANRLAGAEALIRWQHPTRGMVPPDQFIPLAEESSLIQDIGLWVLESACQQLAEWHRAGLPLYLSINVSARQIPDGLPATAVLEALQRHRLQPEAMALEITEGVLLSDVSRAREWLSALHQMGIRVYLDDFGTGYSSLSYLKRFPVDTVKVDKSFVSDMGNNASDRTLVEAIVAMARSLGLEVVAEGVETTGQLDLLRAMGGRYGQGYHFSRPVSAEDFPGAVAEISRQLTAGNPPPEA